MRESARAPVALAFVLAVAACGPKKPPPPVIETQEAKIAPSPPPSVESKPTDTTAKTGDENDSGDEGGTLGEPNVKLLEPGAEPRKQLRHTFAAGSTQKLNMRARTVVKGANLPLPAINLSAPMQSSIVEVTKSGEAKFKFSAGPFKSGSGGGGGDLGGLLGGLAGGSAGGGGGAPEKVAGSGVITARGYVKEYHVDEGAKDEEAPVESGDPFPEEAVGAGARWQVKTLLNEKEGQVRQTTTYTLVKVDKKNVFTRISRVQTPVGGGADAPGAATSSGELVFRLGEIYPTGKLEMTRNMKIDVPGLDATTLKLVSEVTIKR